jgi:cell division protein FtsQ
MTSQALTVAGRPFTAAARLLPRVALPLGRHWRRNLVLLVLLAAVLASGYMFWFRDSSLVRVEKVHVTGLATAPNAPALRAELTVAAKRMSTLHLDESALRRVVAHSPVVHSITIQPDFPHGLVIRVTENRPVAMLVGDGKRMPVAGDGTLLEGVELNGSLPEVHTAAAFPQNDRLPGGGALDRVAVAGAAPAELLRKISTITIQPAKGYVAQVEDGPAIWLGGAARLEEKWDAAAAVLAQDSSAGASYVDVRIPERAVAGGLVIEPPLDETSPDQAAAPATGTPPASGTTSTNTASAPTTAQSPAPAGTTSAPATPQNTQPGVEP